MGGFEDILARHGAARRDPPGAPGTHAAVERNHKQIAVIAIGVLCCAIAAMILGIPLGPWGALRREPAGAPGGVVVDRDGKLVALSRLWKDHRVVVAFYPNFTCDECRNGLKLLNGHWRGLHATVIAISAERTFRPGAGRPAQPDPLDLDLEFEVYADPSLRVFRAWHIPDLVPGMPRPAVFIVEAGGRVSYAKLCDGTTPCPTITELSHVILREMQEAP
jgi:peroxiredoxin